MSEIKVNSIKGVGASTAAITVNNTDGTCTANITNRQNRNLIINGAMQVAQRGTSSTTNGYGSVDRFRVYYTGNDEAPTHAQADVASGTTPYTLGFRKSYKITNGNQTSGAGAADVSNILTTIEAQDVANSGWNYTSASSFITLSFWVKSSVAQNFYGYVLSADGTEQRYAYETGSLTADTWTKITKTIPGNSNIQIDNNNGHGLEINISPFWGTNNTDSGVSLNAWAAHSSSARTPDYGTANDDWYLTNDATFEITGVQLEVSDHATSFEFLSFSDELRRCQRYYDKSYAYGTTPGTATSTGAKINSLFGTMAYAGIPIEFSQCMRTDPTVTLYSKNSANTTGKMSADSTDGAAQVDYTNEKRTFAFRGNDNSGTSQNVFLRCQYTADAEL